MNNNNVTDRFYMKTIYKTNNETNQIVIITEHVNQFNGFFLF